MHHFPLCRCQIFSFCNIEKTNWLSIDYTCKACIKIKFHSRQNLNLLPVIPWPMYRATQCHRQFPKLSKQMVRKALGHLLKLYLSPFSMAFVMKCFMSFMKKVKLIFKFINNLVWMKSRSKRFFCKKAYFVIHNLFKMHQFWQIIKLTMIICRSLRQNKGQ